MLLTLTTTHRPATDLGFLLSKHPQRCQAVELPFGTAHVFYPEASNTVIFVIMTIVLLIKPAGLFGTQK